MIKLLNNQSKKNVNKKEGHMTLFFKDVTGTSVSSCYKGKGRISKPSD